MTSQASYTITAVKDGNDLDGILVLWKKTSTNTAPAKPSGTNLNGWTEDMPEFKSGAFVWTCNRVAISDPTASAPMYIYTDPVLDTHWQKLDEVYKQGTDIKNTVDNITLKYYNTNGEETSFKLTNGAIDITLLKNQVDDAATTATNFISMRSDGGIEVGNKSGGSWTGYRSQMLADSFNILDASGNYLAKFGANTIDLGLNKENSEIRFCDGLLSLKYDADYSAASLTSDGKIRIFGGNEGIVDIGIIHEESAGLKYSTGLTSTYLGCGISASEGDDFSVDVWSDIWLKHDGTGYWNASSSIEITAPSLKIRGQATGSSWYRGRDYALLASTNAATASAYFPVVDCKAQTGDWSMGCLGDSLYFVYTSNTDYTAENNVTSKFGIRNDGMPLLNGATPLIEYGTWTPILQNISGDNPTVSYNWRAGYFYRIGNMVFISADISPSISNVGGNYACIAGLPFVGHGVYHGLSMCEGYNVFNHGQSGWNIVARVNANDTIISFMSPTGSNALNWIANAGTSAYSPILRFSGWYRIA